MGAMKSGKLKDLFLRSLSSGLERDERGLIDHEVFTDCNFSEGFRERVMNRIVEGKIYINGKREILRSFDKVFMRVAIPGAAAIMILVLSLLLSQGSLSYDTLLGIDNQVDGMLVSLMTE